MEKIIPHLWYNRQAREAAEFYTSVFPESKIHHVNTLKDTPSGDADLVSFELWGHPFLAISGGPQFRFNPSVSFMVNFDPSRDANARELLDTIWDKLSEGGKALMPIDKYDFSERYGWIEDKYGLSWQLILSDPEGDPRPTIIPSLLFVGENYGRGEEAANFYLSVFRNSQPGMFVHYPAGMEPDKEGALMYSDFRLEDGWFTLMESGHDHEFDFNEAVSLMVRCTTQEDIDYYWNRLSAVPEAEQCGWLKDKYGVSWQIVPEDMDRMMHEGTPEQVERVTKAFLPMKKFDLDELRKAYEGN